MHLQAYATAALAVTRINILLRKCTFNMLVTSECAKSKVATRALQRRNRGEAAAMAVHSVVNDVLPPSGHPCDATTPAFKGSDFGRDLIRVRTRHGCMDWLDPTSAAIR